MSFSGPHFWFHKEGHALAFVYTDRVVDYVRYEQIRDIRWLNASVAEDGYVGFVHKAPACADWSVTVMVCSALSGTFQLYGRGPTKEAAAAEGRRLFAEFQAEEAKLADPTYALTKLLAHRDWYSGFSDDHGVWARGMAEDKLIAALLPQVPAETVKALWAKHAPADLPCPVTA